MIVIDCEWRVDASFSIIGLNQSFFALVFVYTFVVISAYALQCMLSYLICSSKNSEKHNTLVIVGRAVGIKDVKIHELWQETSYIRNNC